MVKLLRKLVAMGLYAFLLLPGRDYRVDSGLLKAVEVVSTSIDRTLRRRKASLSKEILGRNLGLMDLANTDSGDPTLRHRIRPLWARFIS